uniref:Snakin 3 n=1 Tax=Allium cepa TaxID=4679 RepID=A0A7D5NHT9_ALLCE|nr:snakin 3 [Allium cepa]
MSMASKMPAFILLSFLLLVIDITPKIAGVPASAPVTEPGHHAPAPAPAPIMIKDIKECDPACKGRCALHSRPKICIRACTTCCQTVRCVPPGTYGHRELCGPRYTGWLTHGNRTKCP